MLVNICFRMMFTSGQDLREGVVVGGRRRRHRGTLGSGGGLRSARTGKAMSIVPYITDHHRYLHSRGAAQGRALYHRASQRGAAQGRALHHRTSQVYRYNVRALDAHSLRGTSARFCKRSFTALD
ncbi:uncharacterized protein [Triticum aestivum]|uniref:uncharacterized protein isoform X2 n=1 Tax=Triticum aestivum TaxID=4565 RepID=UPI001D015AA9|nr:uncharacterized protein LOC123057568 isoform X2 [Triticum aestivum]